MYALEQQWINAEDYLYQIEAHSMWMASVAAWVYDQYQPDLLYTWLDTLDAAGHVFYLRDQRQASYTNELAGQYADYYEQAGITADLALQVIMGKTNLNYDTIIMASDHGMAPVHKAVFVNTILEKAGLLVLDRRDYVIEEKSRAFAVASGGVANIYLNLLGRENPGLVSEGVYAKLQQQIVDLFTALKDPDTGELVFGRVLKREELQRFGLDHAHSGDVWVQANPGYNLDGWRGKNMVFADETTLLGQHGYAAKDEMMRGIFLAAGYGIPGESITIAPISITSVAPTVIELLGIPKPDWMVSNAIDFTRR
jgi:predicted AlkP superfamily phosphohydrolase/phosphomutase